MSAIPPLQCSFSVQGGLAIADPMKFSPILLAAALVLSLPLSLASSLATAQDRDCLNAKQAQRLVESGDLLDVPEALSRAGVENARPIGQARLCDRDDVPHWIVNVMNAYGDSERIVLNAQANSP